MFELKPLTRAQIPAVLEKADRYRLLNDPLEAESICLDVIAIDPGNQRALVTLLLALTEQFDRRTAEKYKQARELRRQFADEYSRVYYEGIVYERRAKVCLSLGGPGSGEAAFERFRQAMEIYERAATLGPEGNQDSILRWNTCARILNRNPDVVPKSEDRMPEMLE